jgi:dephospho-CoA kinase
MAAARRPAAVANRFGADVLDANGSVDRRKLAPIVFADDDARTRSRGHCASAVRRAIAAGLRAFELVDAAPLAIVDIRCCLKRIERKTSIASSRQCSPATQHQRLLARGLTAADAGAPGGAAAGRRQGGSRRDLVISTEGTYEETDVQVDQPKRLRRFRPRQP